MPLQYSDPVLILPTLRFSLRLDISVPFIFVSVSDMRPVSIVGDRKSQVVDNFAARRS